MDNDNQFNYSVQNDFRQTQKKSNGIGFGSKVIVPFISGAVGACLIGGICLGVPTIKNELFKNDNNSDTEINTESKKATYSYSSNLDNASYNAKLMDIAKYSETSVAVAEAVLPSVVAINVTYDVQSFGGSTTADATGSGVIISEDGYIITNNHVVNSSSDSYFYQLSEAKSIKVHLYGDDDDTLYDAEIIGRDAETDLAVIKIEAEGLPAITIGDSDNLRVGEFTMAVRKSFRLRKFCKRWCY